MLNLRGARKLLAGLVPEVLARRLGARARRRPGVLVHVPGSAESRLAFGGMELRVPAGAEGDAVHAFVEDGGTVEAMHGLLRVARRRGGLLLDVGAGRGLASTVFCLGLPGNRAVAYEPSPALVRGAKAVRKLNGLKERTPWGACPAPSGAAWTRMASSTWRRPPTPRRSRSR
jgi:hypothetical protein